MKKTHKRRIISVLLTMLLSVGSLSFASASYEQYLPKITNIYEQTEFDVGNEHISFFPDSGVYSYTVPFAGDEYGYGFSYAGCFTAYPQNWGEINEEQYRGIILYGNMKEGRYPIIAQLFPPNPEDYTHPLAQVETGFYVDITVLPALSVDSDITFYKTNEHIAYYDSDIWKGSIGTNYPVGQYFLMANNHPNAGGVGYVYENGGSLEFHGFNLPSDTYTVPKEDIILQSMKCTGIDEDTKTIYMEVTQAQHAIPTTPTQSSQTDATPTDSTATVIAKPTSAPVILDGKNVVFDAYEIADNNYFKIRDLASVLSGTDCQFEVSWDAANQSIQLTSGIPYTPVGNELTKGTGQNQNAKISNSKITLNGASLTLTAYEINGNTYFKLRDLGETLGFVVDWDSAQNTILINTTNAK